MDKIKIELMNDSSEVIHYEREGIRLCIREGTLSAHPGLRAPCHWHDDIECVHILDGCMAFSINGQEIVLHVGEAWSSTPASFISGTTAAGRTAGIYVSFSIPQSLPAMQPC